MDSDVCRECGGHLAVERDTETHEFWGALVSRSICSVVCTECGEVVDDPAVHGRVVGKADEEYAVAVRRESDAYASDYASYVMTLAAEDDAFHAFRGAVLQRRAAE